MQLRKSAASRIVITNTRKIHPLSTNNSRVLFIPRRDRSTQQRVRCGCSHKIIQDSHILQSLYIHYHYHSRRRSFCPWSRLCSLCLAFLRSSVPPLQDTITPSPRPCPPSRAPVIHRAFFPPDHMGRPSPISTEASHVLLTFSLRQWK